MDLNEVFARGGETGALARSLDWSATPLGSCASWPQSLRSVVSIILGCGFPLGLLLGKAPSSVITLYNDAFIPFLGRKHPASLGQQARDTWPEIWDFLDWALRQVWQTGRPVMGKDLLLLVERKGFVEEVYASLSFSALWDEAGEVRGALVCGIETTRQVLAERRERTLRAIALSSTQCSTDTELGHHVTAALAMNSKDLPFALLYVAAPQGRTAWLAAAAGIEAGSPASPNCLPLEDLSEAPWPVARVLRAGQAEVIPHPRVGFAGLLAGSGLSPPRSALILPVSGTDKEHPYGALVVGLNPLLALDEDYRIFLELVAREIGASLASTRALQEARERAEKLAELDRAKTTFLGNVSHEFRTPLTLLLGPVEDMLASGSVTPQQRAHLESVRRNALRLLKLVNGLLDFARIEAGRTLATFVPTDLATLTRGLASAFDSAAAKAGVRLRVDCPMLPEPIYVDRDMWEKIVLNLLSNALKFTFEGEIAVSLRCVGNQVRLLVRDTGTGIPADALPRLFERFYRVPGARSRTQEGTGIGLALVRELVRLHGGTIRVSSALGEGSTFTVDIPRGFAHLPKERLSWGPAKAAVPTQATPFVQDAQGWLPEEPPADEAGQPPTAPAVPPAAGPGAGARSRLPRILVADDSAEMRRYLRRLLAEHYQVETVANGAEALKAARARIPDLILSDIMMPELDGLALLQALRAEPYTRSIPVVLLSARAGDEATLEALGGGADDYLIKPFSGRELLARVRTHLELARARRDAAESHFKDGFLSVASHELKTPLTNLKLNLELAFRSQAQREDGPPPALKARIHRSLERIEMLVEHLLTVSAVQAGELTLNLSQNDLTELCRTVGEEQAAAARRQLLLDLPGERLEVRVDRARIRQVVSSLLSNAFKYSEESQPVVLGLRRTADEACFWVRDRGPGIPADRLPHLFHRFYQAPDIRVHTGSNVGLGLGLFLSKAIVERHGGRIWLDSTVGQGSTAFVALPLA